MADLDLDDELRKVWDELALLNAARTSNDLRRNLDRAWAEQRFRRMNERVRVLSLCVRKIAKRLGIVVQFPPRARAVKGPRREK